MRTRIKKEFHLLIFIILTLVLNIVDSIPVKKTSNINRKQRLLTPNLKELSKKVVKSFSKKINNDMNYLNTMEGGSSRRRSSSRSRSRSRSRTSKRRRIRKNRRTKCKDKDCSLRRTLRERLLSRIYYTTVNYYPKT